MKSRYFVAAAAAALSSLAVAVPAMAAGRTAPSVSFFAGHDGPVASGSAHWTQTESNDSDPFSMQLDVPQGGTPVNGFSSFAGITIHHQDGQPPSTEDPGFDVKSTVDGASGGSPRLVMTFSDGSYIYLTSSFMTTSWQTLGEGSEGLLSYADPHGYWLTSCNPNVPQTYAQALTCPTPAATVASAYIVSDSGWLYPTGYTNYIDNLKYAGKTISQPSDNSNG